LYSRYDALSPAVLKLVGDLVVRCDAAGVRLSVCGEMASRPLEAMALIALGVRELSLTATNMGMIKALVRSMDVAATAQLLRSQAELPDASVRATLRAYALDHGVELPPDPSAGASVPV
jgi:phosphotransferase system enzyme I (PtsP)